jgi:hypothetical protein
MKTNASHTAIGLLLGTLAMAIGCSSDDTTPTLDSGSTAQDDSSMPGTDTGASTMADDGSDTGAVEAASCGAFTTGSPTCDACIQQSCCGPAATCDVPDDTGLDDAGLTGCEQLVSCVSDFCADGGSLSDCEGTCDPIYSNSVQMSAHDLLTCATTNCQAECQ